MKGVSSISSGRGFGMSLQYSKEVSLPRSDSEYKHLAVALGQEEVKDSSVFPLVRCMRALLWIFKAPQGRWARQSAWYN